jgi:cytoskeletal protein RodZ
MSRPNRQKERQPPWEQQAGQEAASFGTWLRRQREIREVPLREIADVTKISLRYLEALEQDRFDVLPAPVFAKGFLREYSRYVGLDADEVVNSFLTAGGDPEETAEEGRKEKRRDKPERIPILLAAVALLIIAGILTVLVLLNRSKRAEPREAPSIAAPTALSPAEAAGESVQPEPAPRASAPLVVTLDFTEDCWVETIVDGERRISELHVQGESMRLEAEEWVRLTLGNPGGVRVEVNGAPYDFDYEPGRVARDLEIGIPGADDQTSGES